MSSCTFSSVLSPQAEAGAPQLLRPFSGLHDRVTAQPWEPRPILMQCSFPGPLSDVCHLSSQGTASGDEGAQEIGSSDPGLNLKLNFIVLLTAKEHKSRPVISYFPGCRRFFSGRAHSTTDTSWMPHKHGVGVLQGSRHLRPPPKKASPDLSK